MSTDADILTQHMDTFKGYTEFGGNVELRPYQSEPGNAIVEAIRNQTGETFVLQFARQSGKDELLANLIAYIMRELSHRETSIVVVNPTFKPQTINSMDRLEARLSHNLYTRGQFRRRSGYIFSLGQARSLFFSGDPSANVVGATAKNAMFVNEAQDIAPHIYDKRFSPMAAAFNAVRIFSGTAWTSGTLLHRELKAAQALEAKDGKRRVWIIDAEEVEKHHPPYGRFVRGEIARHGRNHPFIKTQYFCETIDAEVGMFNPARRILMQGDRPPHDSPQPNTAYAFLIDVAGQDEARMNADENTPLDNPGRDAITLSIASIDLSTLPTLQLPTYRIEQRHAWTGLNHVVIFGKLKALADQWKPQQIVIDATGVGEGLWAMLDRTYPAKVIPVKFSQAVKSEIGWQFLSIIETGRFRDCRPSATVDEQYLNIQSEILPGPSKILRWSVPEGKRNQNGELIHDDHVLADALITALDGLDWYIAQESTIIQRNILDEIDRRV